MLADAIHAALFALIRIKEKDLYHDSCHDKSLAISLDTDAMHRNDGFKSGEGRFATPFYPCLIVERILSLF